MDAGQMDHRATFQRPVQSRDEDGQIVQGWTDGFTAWAAVRYLRGGENVMAARMQSRTPAILIIRSNRQSREVTSEWRVRVRDRAGVVRLFEVKEDPRPGDPGFLEMLAEAQ